jgi:hypothetical protein
MTAPHHPAGKAVSEGIVPQPAVHQAITPLTGAELHRTHDALQGEDFDADLYCIVIRRGGDVP